jgi:hypothetical protein
MSQKTPYDALRMTFDVLNEKLGAFTRSPIDIGLTTSPDYAWIAEALNPTHDSTVLWHFHQKIVIACITYTIATHYYMHYLSERSKIRKLYTEN